LDGKRIYSKVKYWILAGESSGDLHAAKLINSLKHLDAEANFEGWGGDSMQEAGMTVHKHIEELAFMGFIEVIANIRTILKNFKEVKASIESFMPDVIVLVDYPGFNLRLAKWAKAKGYRVIYYIAPQAWAWKANRVEKLKAHTDKLLCILPFEKDWFAERGLDVEYVGHPLLEEIDYGDSSEKENCIALLPGSRKQEIEAILPIMLTVLDDFPSMEFSILKAPNVSAAYYERFVKESRVKLEVNKGALLKKTKAALVASGTATLEAMLYEIPQVVCYKGSGASVQIAKRLIKVPFISLVNLLAKKEVVRELIQDDFNRANLKLELDKLLNAPQEMLSEYSTIRSSLGKADASKNAAASIHNYLVSKR